MAGVIGATGIVPDERWQERQAQGSEVGLRQNGSAYLQGLVVLICELENHGEVGLAKGLSNSGPVALLSQRNKSWISHQGITESSPSRNVKRIDVVDLSEEIQSSTSLDGSLKNLDDLILSEILVSSYLTAKRDLWRNNQSTGTNYSCQIREREIGRQRMLLHSHDGRMFHSVGRSSAAIYNLNATGEPLVRINIANASRNNSYVSPQLSLGVTFSGLPQIMSGNPQSQGEQGNEKGRERGDRLPVQMDEATQTSRIDSEYAEEIGATVLRGIVCCLVFAAIYAALKRL